MDDEGSGSDRGGTGTRVDEVERVVDLSTRSNESDRGTNDG